MLCLRLDFTSRLRNYGAYSVSYTHLDVYKRQAKELIKTEMESAFDTKVPLLVEVGVGDNWLEAH